MLPQIHFENKFLLANIVIWEKEKRGINRLDLLIKYFAWTYCPAGKKIYIFKKNGNKAKCVLGNSRKRYRARGQRWKDPDDTKSHPYCRISCRTLCEKNKWKPYMWTGDKDVNMKAIFAVISTTWTVVEIRPEKIHLMLT